MYQWDELVLILLRAFYSHRFVLNDIVMWHKCTVPNGNFITLWWWYFVLYR
jgi:hypothetical protein